MNASLLPVRMFWYSADPPSEKNPAYELELENYQMHDGVRWPRQMFNYVGGALESIDTLTYAWERP